MKATSITFALVALSFLTNSAQAASFTYDSLQRLKSADYGNSLAISYTYDVNGNRLSRVVTSPYRLITVDIPSGGGTVTGAGIVSVGQIVTLQASPDTHRRFGQWKESHNLLFQPIVSRSF